MLKQDKNFREFIANLDLEKHKFIEPRKTLFSERTECFRTHAVPTNQCNMLTVIACISIVLRDSKFPKGHPIVKNCLTDSNMVEISDYLGFAQVRILPPSDLHLPLLLYMYKSKKSNKLTFPNCVKCADLLQTMLCNHSEKERPIVGVRKTIEINKALTLGYKILDFFKSGIMKTNANMIQLQVNMEYLASM